MKKFKFKRSEYNTFSCAKNLSKYLYAGKGCIELTSPSGKYHDYLFSKPSSRYFPDDVIFVFAIHNDETVFYIGMIECGIFRLTKNSRFLEDTEIVRGARYIFELSKSEERFRASKMKILHLGVCGRCGRLIQNTSKSYEGFGYKCYRKLVDKQ